MKSYDLAQLSKYDSDFREASLKLAIRYSIPIYLADDFVTDGYLKAKESYFDRNSYCTIGGMVQIIQCLMLDYLKSNHRKKTCKDTVLGREPFLDFIFFEDTDFDNEAELDRLYNLQISTIKSLPQNHIEILYKINLQSLEKVSRETGLTYNELRKSKKYIIEYLRSEFEYQQSLIDKDDI